MQTPKKLLAIDPSALDEGAAILRAGGLVAFPTETVYGLGADATSPAAVAKIYAAKGRPTFNPLIAHVGSINQARRHGRFSATAEALAEAFWPGPLTLVVPAAAGIAVCELARAGLSSVALRVPDNAVARALIAAAGRPLAAPSANRSGHVSAVTAAHVVTDLGATVDLVIDDGPTTIGVESTILACLDDSVRLLRPGGILRAAIEHVLRAPLAERNETATPLAPGLLASHYAPRAMLRLDAATLEPGEAGLDFAGRFGGVADALDLSPGGNLVEAAANLFAHLRALDARGAKTIAIAPLPREGLGEAINDRLCRAAAPRA